ncbi:MAG: protein kinase domain-containing protein [Kofleriaceae bacterium]
MTRDPDDPDNLSAPPSMTDSFERLLAEPADSLTVPLTAGSVVAARYEVIERIGAGAMGMVYLATDRELERKIALKLHKKRTGTEQLRREALAMARLAHPNVVTVFEVGDHEGRTFVAMEYVAGTTMRAWLSAERRTTHEILDTLLAAGEGLVAAHEAKLVHRDFKPENVLIGSDGRVRVSDFGLARETGREVPGATGIGASTGIAGTPAYMAPEQALGLSVDARADQYAFCGAAWEALVGAWPRDDKPTRNPRIRRVLQRGLAKDPSVRFSSMRALLGALRAARSRRGMLYGAIVAGVALAGGGAAIAWSSSDADLSCDNAGFEFTTLGLAVPARISTEQPDHVVDLVEKRLATHRNQYLETARKVCAAGTIDRTWSADLHRRGAACLELRFQIEARHLSAALPAPELIDRVVRLVDPSLCGDATVLASQPALPEDPAVLAEMIRVRTALDGATTDTSQNRLQSLRDAIAIADASSVRDLPTIAPRIDILRATTLNLEGKQDESDELMKKAYFAARAIDDPDLALVAMTSLILVLQGRATPAADLETWLANGVADAQRARTRAPLAAARMYIVAAVTNDTFGDPKKVLEMLHEAFSLLGDTPSRPLADALMIRASSYITVGQPVLAYADYLRAIDMFETLYGSEHPVVARIKLTASAAMSALGRAEESIRLADEGAAILDRNPALASREVGQMKLNIGAANINKGDFVKARKYLAEARAMTIQFHGADDPDVALIDSNVAHISLLEKDYTKALALGRDVLAMMERVTPKPHEDRGDLLVVLSKAALGARELEAAITWAEASAGEYAEGDERKIAALLEATRAANESAQHPRALALLEKLRALPAAQEPTLAGRVELERGIALSARDPEAARQAFDAALAIFTQASEAEWVEQVKAARAKLR